VPTMKTPAETLGFFSFWCDSEVGLGLCEGFFDDELAWCVVGAVDKTSFF